MNSSGPTANVLIVDDYAPNILALRATLDGPLYKLFEATSGEEALALCKQHEFALIILDIQMPGMDGFEAAKQIKSSSRNAETPIIFVTAFYQADPFVQKGYAAGAVDYFGKPFDPTILRAKVGIYTDLFLKTKRIQETKETLRAHDQIRIVLDAIPVGIVMADTDGKIFEKNSEAREIWSGTQHEQLQDFKAWWPGTGKRLLLDEWPIVRALKTGEVTKDEVLDIETFDGERKTVKSSGCPIIGKSGEIMGAVGVFQNVDAKTSGTDNHGHDRSWNWLAKLSS